MTQTINQLKALLVKLDQYGHGIAASSTTVEVSTSATKLATLFFSCAVIIYLASLNPLGVPPDYSPYITSFDWARQARWQQVFRNSKAWEPGFMALVFLLAKTIAANSWVFLLIVTFASSFKVGLLYKIASPIAFMLAMILFFFKYFPLQDYNQLRGAIALSFVMLVYYQWTWKDDLQLALLFSVCAVSFHYLALALLPFVFLAKHQAFLQKSRLLLLTLLFLCFLLIGGYVVLEYLAPIIPRLANRGLAPATSSYLSPVLYPEVLLLAISLVFWTDCTQNMKRVITLQLIGLSIFYGFFDFHVIPIRLREAFSIFWLFYLADYSRTTPRLRLATVAFVLMNIALGSYLFYFSDYFR